MMEEMAGASKGDAFEPISPALTPAQSYHLDVNGYVVIENLLDEHEVRQCYDGWSLDGTDPKDHDKVAALTKSRTSAAV